MASNSRSDRDRLDQWITTLRKVRPVAVVVVWEGGEQAIAIRSGATRWQHAAHTAHVLALDHDGHVELRDAAGGVVEMLSLVEDEREPELAEDAVTLSSSDARLLGVLVSAQRMVLQEQRELLEPILLAYTQLAQGYAQYAAQVVELVRLAARVPVPEGDTEGNALMRQFMDSVMGKTPAPIAPVPEVKAP
jgi:hypothetical protein